ncbi:MAG: hypothetical protein U5K54_22455 [Cytophagales bacterium]|nr:hypothetical protein [Cytophagales bacterium]
MEVLRARYFFLSMEIHSFSKLKTDAEVSMFFESTFPDAVELMPTLLEDYNTNPTSSLVTVAATRG